MIPIRDLLARIRWDHEFGRGDFEIAYYDRVRRCLVQVPLSRIEFDAENRFSFSAVEPDGSVHEVPLHRVREVHRDGVLIWQRPPARRAG